MMNHVPRKVFFEQIGSPDEGFLSVSDHSAIIGFEVKRVFWNYGTPKEVSRGRHAHYETEMVLIAVHGEIKITTKSLAGTVLNFTLSDPNLGVFIPRLCWHEMTYSSDAVQLVLCSTPYSESDYIRSKDNFESLVSQHLNTSS